MCNLVYGHFLQVIYSIKSVSILISHWKHGAVGGAELFSDPDSSSSCMASSAWFSSRNVIRLSAGDPGVVDVDAVEVVKVEAGQIWRVWLMSDKVPVNRIKSWQMVWRQRSCSRGGAPSLSCSPETCRQLRPGLFTGLSFGSQRRHHAAPAVWTLTPWEGGCRPVYSTVCITDWITWSPCCNRLCCLWITETLFIFLQMFLWQIKTDQSFKAWIVAMTTSQWWCQIKGLKSLCFHRYSS